MCGICGSLSSDLLAQSALAAQTASIAHRGPDGAGYWHADQVAFGHRRLAIIDLATGDQPLGNEDGSIQALRAELITLGHCFRTDGDTEVIVHAVEQWGDAVFVQREAALIGPPLVEHWLSRRYPLIYDFDDAMELLASQQYVHLSV